MKKSKDHNSFKSVIVLGSAKEKDQCNHLVDKIIILILKIYAATVKFL